MPLQVRNLFEFTEIDTLEIRYNLFTPLEAGVFVKLSQLKRLQLYGNQLTQIKKLQELHLGRNPIPPEEKERLQTVLQAQLPNLRIFW